MVRKKFKHKYESIKRLKASNELNISWSNSSSDNEDKHNFKYKKKTKFNAGTSYFNQFKIPEDEILSAENINYKVNMSPIIGKILPEDLSPTLNDEHELNKSPVMSKKKLEKKHCMKHMNINKLHTSETFYNNSTSTGNINYKINMSPIIGKILPENLSPTLNDNSSDELNKSPVIGKKKLKKKHCMKHMNINKLCTSETFYNEFNLLQKSDSESVQFNISEFSSSDNSKSEEIKDKINFTCVEFQHEIDSSKAELIESQSLSDFFPTYSQQISIDNTSPNTSQSDCPILISQFSNTQESKNHLINKSLTENIQELSINFKNDNIQTNEPLFYYKRQRKKKLKKGGLAFQLQKALHNKRLNTSIWKHEVYLRKVNYEEDFLYLSVTKIFSEFSALICECDFIGENISYLNKNCFVIFDSSFDCNVKQLQKFKLYKPYNVFTIDYLNAKICCYFNVCRILFES